MGKITLTTYINEIDFKKWSGFVISHPNGNIFQTPEMFSVYHETPLHKPFVVAAKFEDTDEIAGILLAVEIRQYKGLLGLLTSRTLVIGGPLVLNDNKQVTETLLKKLSLIIEHRTVYTQFRNLFDLSQYSGIFKKLGYKYEEHLDIHLSLDDELTEIENKLNKEKRKNIRKAINAGLIFTEAKDKDEILEMVTLIKNSYKSIKLPFPPIDLFLNCNSISPDSVRFLGAYRNNNILAGQILLCYKDTAYAWYLGSDSNCLKFKSNDFLYWHVIAWSKKNKFKIFDFGGAGKPNVPYGVRDYKMKFGGNLVNFGRYIKINSKPKMTIGKIGFGLFKLMR